MKKKLLVSLSALILTAALVLTAVVSPASVTALNANSIGVTGANTEYEFEKAGFKNSLDYLIHRDGFLYGADYNTHTTLFDACANMADNLLAGVDCVYDPEVIRRDFYNMRALGFNCTQWWLMWDLQGVYFDDNGLATGVQDKYTDNLRTTLQICREYDIALIPTISNHDLLGGANGGDDGRGFVDLNAQLKYTRFQWDPVAMEAWMENVITPLVEVFAEFPDVVPAVAVGVENISGWVSDYDLGLYRSGLNGTTWANYSKFYNELNRVVKSIMPNTPTTIETMGDNYNTKIRAGLYIQNALDMDCISENYYHSGGYIEPNAVGFPTRPGWIGEMNSHLDGGNANATQEHRAKLLQNMYKSAKANGWLGGFMHRYQEAGEGASLAVYEEFSMGFTTWHYAINEQIDEYLTMVGRANEIPEHRAPRPLYYQGGTTLYWLNSPETASLNIERSQDGGKSWTLVGKNIDPVDGSASNGIGKFVDTTCQDQTTYRYRITATFQDGKKMTSIDTNDSLFWIPPNLVKNTGFEDRQTFVGDYYEGWRTYDGADGAGATAITDEEAHTGKYSLRVDTLNHSWPGYATVNQYLEGTEANLTYRLTVWRKCTANNYYSIKEAYNEPHSIGIARKTAGTGSLINGWFFGSATTDKDWQMHTMDIAVGPYADIGVLIRSGTGNTRMCNYYDDISVVQVR